MNTKGQKGFSIVNIIIGVILTISGFAMFSQTDTYPGPFIILPAGLLFWIWGAVTLRRLGGGQESDPSRVTLIVNRILFILGCLFLAACVLLPFIAPRL